MTFSEKLRDIVDKSLSASKDFAIKAGAKAQDLGEKGVLKLEIAQLEGQSHKLISKLGLEVYDAFVARDQKSITKDSPVVRELLDEIAGVKAAIEKRENEIAHPLKKTN